MRFYLFLLFGLAIMLSGCASQSKLMESISEHDVATARKMVQKGINPFKTDSNGQSAVSLALAANETTETYKWANALAKDSSAKAKELLALIKNGKLTADQFRAELEKASFYIDAPVDDYGSSLLTTLAESTDYVEFITTLIDFNANLDHQVQGGYTALTQATYYGQAEVIKALIGAGANLDAKADTGWTALHYTVNPVKSGNRTHDVQIAQMLIDAGADLDEKNNDGATPLYLSVWNDRAAVRQTLLNAKANPDLAGSDGWTPLIKAVFDGNISAARALIAAGATLDSKSETDWTALHVTANATKNGNRSNDAQLAQMLIDAGADLNSRNNTGATPLYLAVTNDRPMVRRVLLKANADANLANNSNWTPLMNAVFEGTTDAAKDLIAAGAPLESKSDIGWTALHFTVNSAKNGIRSNDAQLAQVLIDAGADLNSRNNTGATPLYLAVTNDRPLVRQVLLKASADTDLANNSGWTPLMRAVFEGNAEAAKALITDGASPDSKDDEGWTALHFTANTATNGNRSNDIQLAKMLIDAGADRNSRSNTGATPLYLTISNDRPEVRQSLLKAKANPDLVDNDGWTPLMQAVYNGNVGAVNALIKSGTSLETKSKKGWTALHFTANPQGSGSRSSDAEIARILTGSGANPNSLNDELVTPLMLTGMNNREDVARVLLTNGARSGMRNKFGRTAEEEAIRADNYRVVALIREFQPKQVTNTTANKKHTGSYPSAPAPRAGYTTCNTRCSNGDCYRTYSDGKKTHFQAKRKYNPFSSTWEYDSGSC